MRVHSVIPSCLFGLKSIKVKLLTRLGEYFLIKLNYFVVFILRIHLDFSLIEN